MKNLYYLLILFLSSITAVFAQQITYTGKNVPLKTVFSAIQKQSGYGFFYDQKVLNSAKPVSLSVQNASLTEVLGMVFKSQPLKYTIANKTILVSSKTVAVKKAVKQSPNQITVPQQMPTEVLKVSQSGDPIPEVKAPLAADTLLTNVVPSATPATNETSLKPPTDAFELTGDNKATPSPPETVSSKFNSLLKPKLLKSDAFIPLDYKKITFGVKGGLTSSRKPGSPRSGSKDFFIGAFADQQITSKFNLGTEINFAMFGSTTQGEIPLHLKYQLNQRWKVLGGPKIDIMGPLLASGNYAALSFDAGTQYQINQIFFVEGRYSQRLISQAINSFRVGIGANFTKNELIEHRTGKPEPLRLRFGISGGAASTSGYGAMAGFDFRIQEDLTSFAAGTLTAGFSHYWREQGYIEYQNFFPVKLGLKLFPTNIFYLAPEAGFAFGLELERDTRPFIYAGSVGAQFKNGFDLSVRYEKISGQMGTYYLGMPVIKNPAYFALRAEYGVNFRPVKKEPGEFSEGKEQPAWTGTRKKSLFLELGGHGLDVSANFDMRLKPNRNNGLGFSAGVGITYESLSIPLVLNYIIGKKRSGVEAGVGITGLISKNRNENYFWYPNESNERFMAAGIVSLGYRLQSYNGFAFKANYTAIYDGLYYGKFFAKDGYFGPNFPGIAVGYTFR